MRQPTTKTVVIDYLNEDAMLVIEQTTYTNLSSGDKNELLNELTNNGVDYEYHEFDTKELPRGAGTRFN